MKERIITGIFLILAILFTIVFAQTPVLPIVIAMASVIGIFELSRCIGMQKAYPFVVPLYVLAATVPLFSRFMVYGSLSATATHESARHMGQYGAILMIVLLFYFLTIAVFSHGKYNLANVCVLFAIAFYVLVGFNSIIIMYDNEQGGNILYLAIFIGAWGTDAFAYFCGRLFGRGGKHKLIPDVSPKKTVEGCIGGIVLCIATMVLFGVVCSHFTPYSSNLLMFALSGFMVAVVAQIGDLLMSYVKRYYGIKDFGRLFPGHGGVLDRFDSIFAVAIAMMCLTTFVDFF